jgi:Ca-activated chloride channel family protein
VNSLAIPVLSAILIVNVTDVLAPFVESASREGRKGNQHYAARDWDHAFEHYEKAAAAKPEGAFQYNLGTAAYQKKDYRTATQAFSRATADAKLDRDVTAYNLGNTRFKAGDLQGALGAYRAALIANPNDVDARANYELTLRQLKSSPPDSSQKNQQQQKNQQNGQDQSQQNQSGQNQDQNQNQQNQQNQQKEGQQNQTGSEGQDKQDQTKQGENQPQEPRDGQEAKADSTGGMPQKPGQMTPAEAKRLLNAVTPEERELLQARLKATRKHRAEKDW